MQKVRENLDAKRVEFPEGGISLRHVRGVDEGD